MALAILLFVGTVAFAQERGYVPLVELPQLDTDNGGISGYFNRLYMFAVAIGAILAFIKISIAGVKWSMSDIVTDKSDARNDIKGALLGLAILLIPFIVLNTIYSGLTNLRVLDRAVQVNTQQSVGGTRSVPTNPEIIARPDDVRVGSTYWVRGCSFVSRGAVIPGQQGPSGEPVYAPDVYDCTARQNECTGYDYRGTYRILNNGSSLRCDYYEASQCQAGIDCPGDTGYVAP